MVLIILAVSIALQVSTALLALRLIKVTSYRFAWTTISAAIMLMAIRRSVAFVNLFNQPDAWNENIFAELIALLISTLMLVGVAKIAPGLRLIAESNRELNDAREALLWDVNKRIEIEKQLLATNDELDSLYSDTPGLLFSFDRTGKILTVSNRWLTVMGYTRPEVLGRSTSAFLTQASCKFIAETVAPTLFEESH